MADAQPPTPTTSPPREDAPADAQQAHSPADSDRTVAVVSLPAGQPRKAIEPMPSSGAAYFSTDCGRLPHRQPPGPQLPPVIVRSDKIRGVVDFANYWRNKHPKAYHCFFPLCGWTIEDLWDNADIHLESPAFLQEVLKFITQDNVYRAKAYAIDWSKEHQDKLELIGGDLTGIYDPNDHLAFVDKVFTDGETNEYPRHFLWHVTNIMRNGMWNVVKNQQAAQAAASVQGAAKADGEDTGTAKLESTPASDTKTTAPMEQLHRQPVSPPGGGPRKTGRTRSPHFVHVN